MSIGLSLGRSICPLMFTCSHASMLPCFLRYILLTINYCAYLGIKCNSAIYLIFCSPHYFIIGHFPSKVQDFPCLPVLSCIVHTTQYRQSGHVSPNVALSATTQIIIHPASQLLLLLLLYYLPITTITTHYTLPIL